MRNYWSLVLGEIRRLLRETWQLNLVDLHSEIFVFLKKLFILIVLGEECRIVRQRSAILVAEIYSFMYVKHLKQAIRNCVDRNATYNIYNSLSYTI